MLICIIFNIIQYLATYRFFILINFIIVLKNIYKYLYFLYDKSIL